MSRSELLFVDLVKAARTELLRVKYKEGRIKLYESIWEKLGYFLHKKKLKYFDMIVGLEFLKTEHGITVFKHLNSSQRIPVRAVNILGEYQLHGIVLSKKRTIGKPYYPPVQKAFTEFIESRRRAGISEQTLQSNELYLSRLSEYLEKQKVRSIGELGNAHVLGFANTLAGTSNATVYCTLCSLRVLFRYLYKNKILPKDFSHVVPRFKIDKTARIPSAYSKDEVQKLLNIVDRGNPKGKRLCHAASCFKAWN